MEWHSNLARPVLAADHAIDRHPHSTPSRPSMFSTHTNLGNQTCFPSDSAAEASRPIKVCITFTERHHHGMRGTTRSLPPALPLLRLMALHGEPEFSCLLHFVNAGRVIVPARHVGCRYRTALRRLEEAAHDDDDSNFATLFVVRWC